MTRKNPKGDSMKGVRVTEIVIRNQRLVIRVESILKLCSRNQSQMQFADILIKESTAFVHKFISSCQESHFDLSRF